MGKLIRGQEERAQKHQRAAESTEARGKNDTIPPVQATKKEKKKKIRGKERWVFDRPMISKTMGNGTGKGWNGGEVGKRLSAIEVNEGSLSKKITEKLENPEFSARLVRLGGEEKVKRKPSRCNLRYIKKTSLSEEEKKKKV